MSKQILEELRKNLDEIDGNLIKLLDNRTEIVKKIGKTKQEAGIETSFAPIRESELFGHLRSAKLKNLDKTALENIFLEIVSSSRAIQDDGRVCVLGEPDGWFNDAAISRFGTSARISADENFEDFYQTVAANHANIGFASFTPEHSPDMMLLIEKLFSGKLSIVEEFNYSPEFSVVTNTARDLSEVHELCVTGEILKLMRHFLVSLSYDLKIKICRSMAEVHESLRSVNPVGAILPAKLVESLTDRIVVKNGLKSESLNRVKFLSLSATPAYDFAPGLKTMLLFPVTHANSEHWYDIITGMRQHKINIAGIHSLNCAEKPWDTILIIELLLPEKYEIFELLLKEFETKNLMVRCCGFYPVFK